MLNWEAFENENNSLFSRLYITESIKKKDEYCGDFRIVPPTVENTQFSDYCVKCYCHKSLACKNFNISQCFIEVKSNV